MYTRKKNKSKFTEYFLVFLLLFVSGNPAFYKQDWNKAGVVILAITLFLFMKKYISRDFRVQFLKYISIFLIIFLIQLLNLGFLSFPFVFGFVLKIFIGAIIYHRLGSKFAPTFFNVMYYVCLASFPFYILHIIGGESAFSGIALETDPRSVWLYSIRPQHTIETILRNSSMFWEPGAFQGYINLCLLLNFERLPQVIKSSKFRLAVILVALITTFSTTGYLVFAVIFAMYVLFYTKISRIMVAFIFMTFLGGMIYLYEELDFMGEKIESQYDETVQNQGGDFDGRRFGALMFDLYYINKNPLTGNGFHEITRYEDHPYLIAKVEAGENLGHGNGFSNFIACAGLIGLFWYLYSIYKFQRKYSRRDALVLCFFFIVVSQGEDYMRFPFFLSLPFFVPFLNSRSNDSKRSSFINLP